MSGFPTRHSSLFTAQRMHVVLLTTHSSVRHRLADTVYAPEAQQHKMAQTTVTGMKDGKAETLVAAHTIQGGVGNTGKQYKAEKISNTNIKDYQGFISVEDIKGEKVNPYNAGPGASNAVPSLVEQSKPKDIKDYSVNDIKELLKKESFPDNVIQKFVENGINGKYFMNLNEDDVLEELDVKSGLLKMKIRTLIAEFSK